MASFYILYTKVTMIYILLIMYYFFSIIYQDRLLETSKILKKKQLENNFRLINISINDMDNFETKEPTKKRTFIKYTWYNWYFSLINYINEL